MTDAFDRRILALYLTFDPPSYRSCMMVIRECVHRHGRLPATCVVDWGSDFESVYFETLLAAYDCIKKSCPKAKPRFGSVIERLFGTTKLIPYDQAFQIFTLPTTRTGRAKVQLTGIRVNYFSYWAEEMRHLMGAQVNVRFDPFDLSLAYAYLSREIGSITWHAAPKLG